MRVSANRVRKRKFGADALGDYTIKIADSGHFFSIVFLPVNSAFVVRVPMRQNNRLQIRPRPRQKIQRRRGFARIHNNRPPVLDGDVDIIAFQRRNRDYFHHPRILSQMKSPRKQTAPSSRWFQTGFGRLVALREQRECDRAARAAFGFYALQLGRPDADLLRRSPVESRARVSPESGDCLAEWDELPFESGSIDSVVAAHALDAAKDPRDVLREIVRVLRPEGRLFIVGFNPISALAFRARAREIPWAGKWLSLHRVKDWLALLEMTVIAGSFSVFRPPVRNFQKWAWMEKAGARWWPMAGGVYFITAVKRRPAMRVIRPAFAPAPVGIPAAAGGEAKREMENES